MLAVAEKLNRRWIGCDLGRWGIHATRKRLLGVKHCRPFVLLNLGQEERRHWRDANFGEGQWEYVAFMLKLYGAEPVAGFAYSEVKTERIGVHRSVGCVNHHHRDRRRRGRVRQSEASGTACPWLELAGRTL